MSSRIRTLLDRVASDLDRVLSDDALAGLSDAERVDVLTAAGAVFRRAEAVIVETIATGDPVDFPHATGCRSQNELLQRTVLTDVAGATRIGKVVDAVRRDVNLVSGERLPERWPTLHDALRDGVIGVPGMLAATAPIEKVSDRLSVDERLGADQCLADAARGIRADSDDGDDLRDPAPTTDDLALLAETLAALLDPDGDEPGDEPARRRSLTLGRMRDGLRSIKGHLTPEVAAQLDQIFDAVNNPKGDGPPVPAVMFSSGDEGDEVGVETGDDDPFNSDPRNVLDDRTAAQKRHDALAAALGIAARHKDMPTIGGASPTLVVTVDAKDLASGTGRASVSGARGQVPLAVAAHVGCSGAIQRVLFDDGRIIGISTTGRVFTVHQRRAIIARDKECLIPGCHVPASWCEIHHVTEHARGGPTHTDNGVPLCCWHHRSLGTSGWAIRMNDGVPEVSGPRWWDPDQRWRTPRLSVPESESGSGSRSHAFARAG